MFVQITGRATHVQESERNGRHILQLLLVLPLLLLLLLLLLILLLILLLLQRRNKYTLVLQTFSAGHEPAQEASRSHRHDR